MAILTELQEEQEASSSYEYEYDVFLSFRGKDTRLSFTDHLYRALINENIYTFLDEQEVETGEELKPELARAIKTSRASIIVLSENYASSTWCLDELLMILEQQEKRSNYIVIPIFYHVEPTHVRKQESSFGEAMANHKQMIDVEKDQQKKSQRARKLELWTRALTQVAGLKGPEAHGRRETVLIEEIVKEINVRLGLHLQRKIPHLIGMHSSISFITSWLEDEASTILTIWGMAGIGKTSLAEYVYKLHFSEFKTSSFVEGIGRKCAEQSGALLDFQKQLLGDILKKSTIEVRNINVCSAKIEKALFDKQTLLVLDDIDNFEQLDALIGTKGFHSGTKIIITTKDGSVTEKCALLLRKTFPTKHTKHNLSGLDYDESLSLLCWHAFGNNAPKEGYEQEAKRVVKYCGGHPLALKILGGSLINEDVATWSYIFERFETKKIYTDIQKVLQISFDLLPSGDCQELFKHIACFFVGKDREATETILKECGIRTSYGITKLIDRCLLTIGMDTKLEMHQLVQEMGRDLVRQESPKKPWKRSRLWNHGESLNLLIEDKGTSKVCGLILDMMMLEEEPLPSSNYVTKHKFQDVLGKKFRALSLIQWVYEFFSVIWGIIARFFLMFSSPHCKTIELRTNILDKMDKLNLLQLNHVKLKGSYKNFPQGLRWLCMHGFRLKYIPSELPMGNLVALDMSYSDLEQLWKKPMLLGCLKILNLSHCIKLVRVCGFSGLPSLERLILEGCVSLNHVCESIGRCARLVLLDISYCSKLIKLPNSIWELKKVEILSVSGCIGVDEFPMEMKDMESLKVLQANSIPKSVLHSLPPSLVILSLKDNNLSNESFPNDFSSMIMLKELYLDNNPIDSLPTFVRSLSKLETLSLDRCFMLKSVLFLPSTIKNLNLDDCSSLVKVTFHEEMSRPPFFNFMGTESLNEIQGVMKFHDLAQVDEEILSALGWTNLECVKDQELKIMTPNMWSYVKKSVQMVCAFGIFSTCFHGKEVPNWLGGHKISNGSSISNFMPLISFMMPSTPVNKRFQGFNIASVRIGKRYCSMLKIRLVNETKNLTCHYPCPLSAIGEGDESEIVWLSHWMFGNNEFEDGDKVTVTIYENEDEVVCDRVKEFVISPMYGERSDMDEEEDPLAYYKSWKYRIYEDPSKYQFAPGYYYVFSNYLYKYIKESAIGPLDGKRRDMIWCNLLDHFGR